MSHQLTFADNEFNNKRRKTRKEVFLSLMDELMPWDQLEAIIEPFYPKAGKEEGRIHCRRCSAFTACSIGTA
jgi:transposase, IS5 family